jgi:hypothetical protein
LDFLLDDNLKVWLIEANHNPGIWSGDEEVENEILPKMLDELFCLTID